MRTTSSGGSANVWVGITDLPKVELNLFMDAASGLVLTGSVVSGIRDQVQVHVVLHGQHVEETERAEDI